jgi:hypothetical protein
MRTVEQFEKQVEEILTLQPELFSPLEIFSFIKFDRKRDQGFDATLEIGWKGRRIRFVTQIKSRSVPKLLQEAIWQIKRQSSQESNVILIIPYITESVVKLAKSEDISFIDLNGNYLIQTKSLVAIRLDRKNQYPEAREIKNIFAGNSSEVGRLLLNRNYSFRRVNDVYEAILQAGGSISLATVSKVLNSLQEQLIINKSSEGIRMIQPAKLLDGLRENYRSPRMISTLRLNLPTGKEELRAILNQFLGHKTWIWSGESSAQRYAITTPANLLSVYTKYAGGLEKVLGNYKNSRFYNCTLFQTSDSLVYFDAQDEWASKIQCYLELSKLDKRERQISKDIEADILRNIDG